MQRSVRPGLVLCAIAFACSCSKSSAITPNTAGWWRDRTFYEVFVRSFADSDGDGIGDLKGLTARLDYLNDGNPQSSTSLGVGAIWLMPIFPSPSYHGYDVSDYRAVNPQYGTLDDFDALVKAAHQRGIKLILDMVLNHTSSRHPWFANSAQGASADKRGWYDWSATDPGWRRPWDNSVAWYSLGGSYYYGLFCPCMPDLNLENPAVEQELVSSMKFWLARGVDGFRLDAVRYFIESASGGLFDQAGTHAFLRRIRAALQSDYPDALLVAEAWAPLELTNTYYGAGDEVQLAFSFDVADALKSAAQAGDASGLVNTLAREQASLAGKDPGFQAPFLSNHDQVRALRAMGGDSAAARVAAAAMLALPGTPFLYYGEEIGMKGGAGGSDQEKRTPLRWDATAGHGFTTGTPWFDSGEALGTDVASQQADAGSLWNEYRRLLALRRGEKPLNSGDLAVPAVHGGGAGTFAALRTDSGKRVLFVANFAAAPSGPFSIDAAGTAAALEPADFPGLPAAASGTLSFPGLEARSFAYLSLN